MFQKVEVPVLGIVENMSTHVCSNCGHEEHIFGAGGGARMAEQYGVELLGGAAARYPHPRAGRRRPADRRRRAGLAARPRLYRDGAPHGRRAGAPRARPQHAVSEDRRGRKLSAQRFSVRICIVNSRLPLRSCSARTGM